MSTAKANDSCTQAAYWANGKIARLTNSLPVPRTPADGLMDDELYIPQECFSGLLSEPAYQMPATGPEVLPYKEPDSPHTTGMKELYAQRKETIERIFGTAKVNHGFRYTQMIGKARMEMKAGLTFACLNLKKLAKMKQRLGLMEKYICWLHIKIHEICALKGVCEEKDLLTN